MPTLQTELDAAPAIDVADDARTLAPPDRDELAELVEDVPLVEEISIDGMCGVY